MSGVDITPRCAFNLVHDLDHTVADDLFALFDVLVDALKDMIVSEFLLQIFSDYHSYAASFP